ncbi:hypothetical protein EV715DRAFT_213598 [Schizophyllum commune]
MLSKHASSNPCDTQADALEALDCALARLEVCDELRSSSESQPELSAPVDRVPAELWDDIFLYACADTILAYPLRADMLTARTLGQVCQRWRDIALDDTRLWVVSIDIDMDRMMRPESDVRDFYIAVSLYLARSDDHSLSVEMYWGGVGMQWSLFPGDLGDECYGDLRLLLLEMSESFWRWEDCAISGNILDYISCGQYPSRLISCCVLDGTADNMTRLGSTNYSAMAKILAHCEAVEHLQAEVDEYGLYDRKFPANAWLPHLRECVIQAASLSVLKSLLRCLRAPSLEFLELNGPRNTSGWAWPSEDFARFMERDGHPTDLSLCVGFEISDDVIHELRNHPSIFEVVVYGS